VLGVRGNVLRAAIGIVLALCLVIGFTNYGGAGVSLLLIALNRQTPSDFAYLYGGLGVFGVFIAFAMLCAELVLLSDFIRWDSPLTKVLRQTATPTLLVLSLVHILAYIGAAQVQNEELSSFVVGFSPYAVLALIAWGADCGSAMDDNEGYFDEVV
jgi:hypothetical protein